MAESGETHVKGIVNQQEDCRLIKHRDPTKLCIENCTHDGLYAEEECLRCCTCGHWYHINCLNVPSDETGGVWPCYSCRQVPNTVINLQKTMHEMLMKYDQLVDIVKKQQTTIERLADTQIVSSGTMKTINTGVQMLTDVLVPDAEDTESEADDEEEPEADGELLLGDCILRDIQSKSDNVTVEYTTGGKICDVRKRLRKVNPKRQKYKTITLICGTNDNVTKRPIHKIMDDYKSTIQEAKLRAETVVVSSVLPRTDENADMSKIDNVNQLLVTLVNETGCQFVNQDTNFRYRDDSVDDTLLSPDGVHLSANGVRKVIGNLKLDDKVESMFGKGPVTGCPHGGQPVEPKAVPQPNNPTLPKPTDPAHEPKPQPPPPPPKRPNQKSPTDKLYFRSADNPCSNFYYVKKGIPIYEQVFHWSEQAYQYRKAMESHDWESADRLLNVQSAREAKDIGDKIDVRNTHWDLIKENVMYEIVQLKCQQCPEFKHMLIASAGKELVEQTNNRFWAEGPDGKGKNALGKLLMALRDRVISEKDSQRSRGGNPVCYHCGETNHLKRECKFTSPIRCYNCGSLGHKQKHRKCQSQQH